MKKHFLTMTIIGYMILPISFNDTATAKSWTSFSNIALDKEWKIKFNRHIDPNSVHGNAYIMQGTTKIATTTSVKDNILFVKPTSHLKHSTSYTVIVTSQIRDTKGRTMQRAQSIPFFTVAEPAYQTFEAEYSMMWHMPTNNYEQFHLIGRTNNLEVGGYDTRAGHTVYEMKIGSATRTTVQAKYGQPLTAIKKGNINYNQNYVNNYGDVTNGTYLINNHYVTFFYDVHKNNVVRSVQWVNAATEATKPTFFRTNTTDSYRAALEEMMVHLINQARVAEGLHALTYTPQHNDIGRKHSADMVAYTYFSHTDRNGGNAMDRMNAANLQFSWYGENLAYGQYSAIYAHEALMNSKGHRDNILRANFTHVLVGVAFTDNGAPYFTINFYRP